MTEGIRFSILLVLILGCGEVIAATVAANLGLKMDTFSLRRVRHTPPQSGLDRRAREKNPRGCFRVHGKKLQSKHTAIIDDVMTTGATVNELSRTLLKADVADVQAWVVARA